MLICCCLWHYLMSSVLIGCDLCCSMKGVGGKILLLRVVCVDDGRWIWLRICSLVVYKLLKGRVNVGDHIVGGGVLFLLGLNEF